MPLTSFIGRERELALLEKMIRKRDVRLISLTGPGGIGKTRLSLELVALLNDPHHFTDGIYFIDLQTVDNAGLVISAIAQVFGIREKAEEELVSSLKSYLRDKNLLLILDNFEHVQAAAAQVLEVLKASRGVKFLITSREKFDLYGEHNFEVPPLSLTSHSVSAHGEMNALSEAVQLFVERAQAIYPYFELNPENAAIVQQICDRLDGLPLAIELMAVQSKRFTPQELLKRLDDRLQLLVGGQSDLPARHRTLQAAVDWSYRLLDASEQALFVSLSVFNGSFTLEAAQAVCARDAITGTQIAQMLISLRSKSLLSAQRDESRYVILGSFREYGHGLLDEQGAQELGRYHAAYYESLLAQSHLLLPDQRIERLKAEMGNLRAALKWALANNVRESALRISIGMYDLWLRLGNLREGRQRLFEVLDASEDLTSPLRAQALYCAGALADWLGEYQIVQSLYRESLRLYEAAGDATGTVSALLVLASALVNQGDYIEGRALSEQALHIAREHRNDSNTALALNNLGMIATYQGEALKARDCYAEALSLWQSMPKGPDAQGMAWALTGLSWVELLQAKYESAQDLITQSLDLYRQAADMLGTVIALTCESWIALYRADLTEARSKLENCLTLCRSLGLINLTLWPLVGLARIDLHHGNAPQVRASLEEALRLCEQLNYPPMTTWVYIAFGKLLRLEGDIETAFDYRDRGLMLSHKRDDKSALVTALEEFAAHFAAQNRVEPAAQLYGAAEALRETYGLPLPTIDRIEYIEVTRGLQSKASTAWKVHGLKGRSLVWDEVVQLITHRHKAPVTSPVAE